MNRKRVLESLESLRRVMSDGGDKLAAYKRKATADNPWFTPEFLDLQFQSIIANMLDPKELEMWVPTSAVKDSSKKVGVIMAGNLPLVGFHDLLSVLVSGHRAMIKLSDRDSVLLPGLVKLWLEEDDYFRDQIAFVDNLKNIDVLLATGSDTTMKYIEYYFKGIPKLIRDSRNGVAVLDSDTTDEDLDNLMDDIFTYFGLGCRNVSKVYVPKGFELDRLFISSLKYKSLINHPKYKNNYDYNFATAILNREDYLTNDLILLKREKQIPSRIACLHYEEYEDIALLKSELEESMDQIQCVVAGDQYTGERVIPFGQSQYPKLGDYADGKDVLRFLQELN